MPLDWQKVTENAAFIILEKLCSQLKCAALLKEQVLIDILHFTIKNIDANLRDPRAQHLIPLYYVYRFDPHLCSIKETYSWVSTHKFQLSFMSMQQRVEYWPKALCFVLLTRQFRKIYRICIKLFLCPGCRLPFTVKHYKDWNNKKVAKIESHVFNSGNVRDKW